MLFNYIKKSNISVVWTLHDCWAFTGQCPHFSMVKCYKWKTGCYDCPQYKVYPASYVDKTKVMYSMKKKWFNGINDMKLVTPSNWLAERVADSFMNGYRISVINNGIDLNIFKPTQNNLREHYNLRNKVVLLGVAHSWGKRKGIDIFMELAEMLDDTYQVLLVGLTKEQLDKLPSNIIGISRTQSQNELAEIYTMADYFINPSREESMGLVTIEALACGTPAIVSNFTAVPEVIDSKSGIIVKKDNAIEYLKAIINNTIEFKSSDCINRAKQYDMNKKYKEYLALYDEVIQSKKLYEKEDTMANKIKIAILTFHRTINYGGVLQAYALKKVLEKFNCESNIIDYKNEHIEKINKVRLLNFCSLKEFLNGLFSYKSKRIKLMKFREFNKEFLCPVGKIDNEIEYEYDAFIVGSDQVWNYLLSDFDKKYFLNFLNDGKKKNAYAASFGFSDIPNELAKEYENMLKSFNKISVREKSGEKLIKELIGIDVPVVLDPTLLLNQTEWKVLLNITAKSTEKYILLYLMVPEENIIRFTKELSEMTGYKIRYITSKIKRTMNAEYMREVSPVNWIELFMNAAYVVTNSFHGVSFSINFNKNFFMGFLPEPSKVNSRLEHVLQLFGLEDRKISKKSKPRDFKEIDYEPVNSILLAERDKSFNFLRSIIGDNYEQN